MGLRIGFKIHEHFWNIFWRYRNEKLALFMEYASKHFGGFCFLQPQKKEDAQTTKSLSRPSEPVTDLLGLGKSTADRLLSFQNIYCTVAIFIAFGGGELRRT